MSTEIVEQLEVQVVAMQFSLCNRQKQMQDYFKMAPTPFKTVADASKEVSLVDSLDMDDMELESINTTVASVAASALMKETPTWFSTPKCSCPPASESLTPPTPVPQPSTSTATATPSQPPAKKMKLNLGLSHPWPKILSTSQAIEKLMNSSLSACSSVDSDSESASSQE